MLIPVEMRKPVFTKIVSSWWLTPYLPTNTFINPPGLKFPADEFWGTICGCTSRTPPSRSVIWDHCQFLSGLGICYYPYLGFFICLTHGDLVHPFHLASHLKNLHSLGEAVGRKYLDKGGWVNLKGHIQRSFRVQLAPPSGSSPEFLLPKDWSTIDVPVPGLRVILGFQCLLCGWLQGSRDSFRQHYLKKHKRQNQELATSGTEPLSPNFKHYYSRVLMQGCFKSSSSAHPPLFPLSFNRWYLQVLHPPTDQGKFQLSESKTQFSSCHTPSSTPPSPIPSYISTLGWIDWLHEIESSQDILQLRWLVSIPTSQKTGRGSDLEKVEHGLWQTSQLLKEYLRDGEEKLDSMAAGVRDAIRGR